MNLFLSTVIFILLTGCLDNTSRTSTARPDVNSTTGIDTGNAPGDSNFMGELVFGTFCGECRGNCAPMFRLNTMGNATTLWADYQNNYFKGPGKLEFKTELDTKEKMQIAYEVMSKLPKVLVDHPANEKTFGCPDCTDGCGVYVEFKMEPDYGKPKRFRFDSNPSDTIPKEITAYAGFVKNKVRELLK